jgi:glycosyltransferase involved in cell wall biosynthesis
MGGAEVFTHEVAKRWVRAGHEVTLFTSEFPSCKREEVLDGVRIVRAGGRYSVYMRAREYYKKYFFKEKFDVVIDEINTVPFFTPKFVNNGERIVALIHQLAREYWFYETPFPINIMGYYFFEDRWLKNYTEITTVTISESTKMDLINLGFKKVFIVHEGISFNPLKVPDKEREPTVIYLGRLKRAKRPDLVIKAFKIVKEKISNAKLWIVGDGYLRKDLEKVAPDGVKFFGHVSEEEKIKLLSKAWVMVNPSIREGWGINVIEANACGTPAVAYDIQGLRDSIINEETGLLVKENGNVEKLAGAIIRILEDEMLRKTLSANALEYSKNFSWDKAAQEFEKILKETATSEVFKREMTLNKF